MVIESVGQDWGEIELVALNFDAIGVAIRFGKTFNDSENELVSSEKIT